MRWIGLVAVWYAMPSSAHRLVLDWFNSHQWVANVNKRDCSGKKQITLLSRAVRTLIKIIWVAFLDERGRHLPCGKTTKGVTQSSAVQLQQIRGRSCLCMCVHFEVYVAKTMYVCNRKHTSDNAVLWKKWRPCIFATWVESWKHWDFLLLWATEESEGTSKKIDVAN